MQRKRITCAQLFTKDESATNETFKSLESVLIEEDTCKFTRDFMFTRVRVFRVQYFYFGIESQKNKVTFNSEYSSSGRVAKEHIFNN